jgi:ferrous iron transport protein A
MITTLNNLVVSERAVIKAIRAQGKLRRRLQDMGVVKNTEIEVVNTAPLGDPIVIKIRGFDLALRREEAAQIEVEVVLTRLSGLRTGDAAIIESFEAGRGLRRRLLSMGITPGEMVRVVRAESSGPIVISVKDTRVMLGRGMSRKILVCPQERAEISTNEKK